MITTSRKAAILSSNEELRTRVIHMLEKVGITYLIKEEKIDLILSVFNPDLHLVFVDIDHSDEERFKMIRILKKIRPRLNIIVIINELTNDTCEDYIDAGAHYCLLNIHKEMPISSLAGSIESFEEIEFAE